MPSPMSARPLPSSIHASLLAALAMLAFAGNSLLCRLALRDTMLDAASFTTLRLVSGALVLWLLVLAKAPRNGRPGRGSWPSALALFAYAAAFSFAYLQLTAATGALVLFGAVQATMIGVGLWRGERFSAIQLLGFVVALAGLVVLLLPGVSAPPLASALLMAAAGVAWGVYSLRGARAADPLGDTAGNFLRAAPLAIVLSLVLLAERRFDAVGAGYAVASGALASGLGYAAWYAVLPRLSALRASVLQLSVPAITAVGGVLLLDETLSLRLLLCSVAVLGGVLLVVATRTTRAALRPPAS
jgi:drug/metabolite transporter (DMT)-like permease